MIPKERKPADHGTKAKSTRLKEEWQYIENPLEEVRSTDGLLQRKPKGTKRTEKEVRQTDEKLAKERSSEILSHIPKRRKCVGVNMEMLRTETNKTSSSTIV